MTPPLTPPLHRWAIVMTPPLTPPLHRWAIVIYSLASAVGQNFIYYTITQFNPLVLTTVPG